MQKKKLLRKGLAVGIILLFIGIAVAPSISINVVKASNDNELIEVTTQACGIKGFGNTTVKLTKQHYQNLEQYLVDFRARLNQTTTREEAVPIFNEAVVELNKYGLLPKGMSVEQAQRLVIGGNQNPNERLLNYKQRQEIFPKCANIFCLLAMNGTGDIHQYINIMIPLGPLGLIILLPGLLLLKLGLLNPDNPLIDLLLILYFCLPFRLMSLLVNLGYEGVVHSFGLKGVVDRDSFFVMWGYTGLMLYPLPGDNVYLLGSALAFI